MIVPIPATANPLVTDPVWWASEVFSVRSAPLWVRALLAARQALVGILGIDKAGRGVFDVDSVSEQEALIAEDDTHLDFRDAVSLSADPRLLQVVTVVRLHGWRGRLYWVPVSLYMGL